MNIYAIQDSIVSLVQSAFEALGLPFTCKHMPDNPDGFNRAVINPIVYVINVTNLSDPPKDTRVVSQNRKLQFNFEIQGRNLYGANGLYAVRDLIEQIVTGFQPLNSGRLYLLRDDISQTTDNIWVHVYQFQCTTFLVQKDDSDPIVVPSFVGVEFSNE